MRLAEIVCLSFVLASGLLYNHRAHAVSTLSPGNITTTTTIKLRPTVTGYGYSGACVKKGTVITVKGTNFGSQKGRVALGGGSGTHLDLTIRSWSATQISVTIPNSGTVQGGKSYYIGIENKAHAWLSNTNKSFSICAPVQAVPIAPGIPAVPVAPGIPAVPVAPGIPPAKPVYEFESETTRSQVITGQISTGSLWDAELPPPPKDVPKVSKKRNRGIEPGEIIVISANMNQAKALARTAENLGIGLKRRHKLSSLGLVMTVLRVPKGVPVNRALSSLTQADRTAWADTNNLFQLHGSESRRYGAKLIGWDYARAKPCRTGIRIGLVDTGIDKTHPALKGQAIVTRSFVTTGIPKAGVDHGTAITTLLLGNNEYKDMAGLLPGAKLYVASIFRKQGKKQINTTAEWIVLALDWLASQRTHIINLSLGGSRNLLVEAAIARLQARGFIVIASAGNNGPTAAPVYPAAQEGVIAVTAVDAKLKSYRRANRGSYISFAAPGVDVWTAKSGGKGVYVTGTSYATPFVTASLAATKLTHPAMTWTKLRQYLVKDVRDLGIPGKDPVYGWGLIQAKNICGKLK